MDDSCAVCAENLDWVAYGACGHRDMCSTCVVRLRFICNDRHCCICKTESNVIFVTKALGDYTMRIKDFSVLPYEVKEGRAGSYWYHEDTQAFFDDVDHYKMIKAMCKLSCNECDKTEDQLSSNIEQLRDHLFHRHRLVMCSLCLEGRKAFICEQKLYTRAQLNQHISTGDSEVDGTESERGRFMGHPKCEFCKTSFYGESELYTHMYRDHYTCHICQRQHPGQCRYYNNYDDLEIHFRQDHYQCEDEACLAKKFIVFRSIVELKRHNTSEHGGRRMSRAHRSTNAALQISTSFQYLRGNEDYQYDKRRMLQCQPSDNNYQISMAVEACSVTANVPSISSTVKMVSPHGNTNYIQNNTKEAHEWHRKNRNKMSFSSAQAWQETSRGPNKGSSSSSCANRAINIATIASLATGKKVAQTSYASSSHAQEQTQPTTSYISTASCSLVSLGDASRTSHLSSAPNLVNGGYSESKPSVPAAQRHKSKPSVPAAQRHKSKPSVPAAQRHKQSSSSRVLRIVEEVQKTNKSRAEKMLS